MMATMVPITKLLYTVRETAEILSLSRSQVYELIWTERLASKKIGRSRRISLASIERFASEHRGRRMSRRSPGEGSVYQLADGTWRGFVDLGWKGGRRRRKYVRGRTKAEVQREVRRLARQAEEGRLSPERAPTLAAWLERYLDEVAAPKVRPSTLHRYRQEVRLYIGPSLGKVRLDKLEPERVSDFYQEQLTSAVARQCSASARATSAIAGRRSALEADHLEPGDAQSIRRASHRSRCIRTPPRRRATSSQQLPAPETRRAGSWPSRSVCVRARRWALLGETSTSTAG